MLSKHLHRLGRPVSMLIALSAGAMLCACSPAATRSPGQSTAANSISLATPSPAQLVAQLQQAQALDKAGLNDPTTAFPRKGDFVKHEGQAADLISDLEQGVSVSRDDVDYALEVPPRHLQSDQRSALVQQLQNAIQLDERREQGVVAFGSNLYYEDPDAPSQFGAQEEKAQKQIRALAAGKHVSWDDVQQALYVPPNPL
jgi:hypothetical protein